MLKEVVHLIPQSPLLRFLFYMLIQKHESDRFNGVCNYHSHCLEGLASGPAIEKRWGKRAEYLYENKMVWEMESFYIAQALVDYTLCYSPKRIVLGGGVINKDGLLDMIREDYVSLLNNYIKTELVNNPKEYIVGASLKGEQGIMGCLKIAMDSIGEKTI